MHILKCHPGSELPPSVKSKEYSELAAAYSSVPYLTITILYAIFISMSMSIHRFCCRLWVQYHRFLLRAITATSSTPPRPSWCRTIAANTLKWCWWSSIKSCPNIGSASTRLRLASLTKRSWLSCRSESAAYSYCSCNLKVGNSNSTIVRLIVALGRWAAGASHYSVTGYQPGHRRG